MTWSILRRVGDLVPIRPHDDRWQRRRALGTALSLPWRTNLTFRVTLAFVALGLVILVGVAALAFYSGRTALEHATISGLTALAVEKEARLDSWFEQKASEIRVLAASPYLVTTLPSLRATPPSGRDPDAARDRLNDLLGVWLEPGRTFSSIFVLDAQTGRILAATDARDIGKFKEDRPYFIEGKNGAYVQGPYYSLPEGGPSIVFSAPIKTADGRLVGVVAGRAIMAELQAIIERDTNKNGTDDNFIVNKAGLFVTQPRYLSDKAPLRFGTQSDYVKDCLDGSSGVALTGDYRAVPVIATYRWIAERQFCLVAKVDQAEALAPILVFKNSILLIGIAVLIVATAIAIGLARSITRPIKELQTGAERLGGGERDIRLPERSQDELGVLAREFNKMARSLTQNEEELKQRAEDLRAVNARLGETNVELEKENAERRRAEDEVRALNEGLEQRVAARTAELEAVNRELASFAYSVSHDLRAPLRHMDGFSQALLEDYGDRIDAAAKDLLLRIRSGSVRMGRLIDDLLKLSRMSRGELEREHVDLSAMAHRVVAELRQADPDRKVVVEIAENLNAAADPRLMEVALQNLLGNAWKFTAKNPGAEIVFGRAEHAGRMGCFIRDNGVGFDMAYAGKLFAPFQRLHTTAEFEGTGIGLATVSRIIHRHGGEIRIESAIGKGTAVYFTI